MKKFFYIANLVISLLFIVSCQDENLTEMQASSQHSLQTRSITPEYFDWENADTMPTPKYQSRIYMPWDGPGSLATTYDRDVLYDF